MKMSMNKQQSAAVESNAERKAIIAGAGTGKTFTITRIIEKDITENEPSKFVAITFTRNAAMELTKRLFDVIGNPAKQIFTGTIHSFCLNLLDDNIEKTDYQKDFVIYDQDDRRDIITSIIKTFDIKISAKDVINYVYEKMDGEKINENIYANEIFVYNEYKSRMIEYNAIDFDMILQMAVSLLENNKDIIKDLKTKHTHFYVDEFQDTNYMQLQLLKLIDPKNLVVIGDPDQSIYEWNHARPGYIINIQNIFEGMELFKLETNYRSTRQIIKHANRIIENNVNRIPKKLKTDKEGTDPISFSGMHEYAEAEYIKDVIEKPYKNYAIIARTNPRKNLIADYLAQNNIPINVLGGRGDIFTNDNIKSLIKLMRIITNPNDDYLLKKVMDWPNARLTYSEWQQTDLIVGMTNKSYFKILSDGPNQPVIDFCSSVDKLHCVYKEKTTAQILYAVINDLNILHTFTERQRITRVEEIEEFRKAIKRWQVQREFKQQDISLKSFLRFIMIRDIQESYNKEKDAVNIMTVHGSKGLEFENVIVAGMNDGEFPSMYKDEISNLEEERRLFYVAITRAKEKLYLTRSEEKLSQWKTAQATKTSRFINEFYEEIL